MNGHLASAVGSPGAKSGFLEGPHSLTEAQSFVIRRGFIDVGNRDRHLWIISERKTGFGLPERHLQDISRGN